MGLLSKLLNPLQGPKDVAKMLAPKQQAAAAAPAVDPAAMTSSYGDSTDPGYGSFTKPFDAEEFYKYQDPGYAFRQQQGMQGVLNGAGAGSGAMTGAAMKDLIGYNQDLASTEYGN